MTTKLHLLNKKTISIGQKFLWFAEITHALKSQKITDALIESELEKIKKIIEDKTKKKLKPIKKIKSQKSFKIETSEKKNETYKDKENNKNNLKCLYLLIVNFNLNRNDLSRELNELDVRKK